MASMLYGGPRVWSGGRDSEGFDEYKVTHLVQCERTDGPVVIMSTPGLPAPGSVWNFGGAEVNLYAYCKWDMTTSYVGAKGGSRHYEVEQTFTTKPIQKGSCREGKVENPLLEPQKVKGLAFKSTEEATVDMFGNAVCSSSFEQLRGPANEWERYSQGWTIGQNVASLQLDLCATLANTVNAYPIWGCAPRTVRLTGFSWERKFYGTCFKYYTREFEFLHDKKGWDRPILDEGTKVLNGHWSRTTGNWVLDPVARLSYPKGISLTLTPGVAPMVLPPGQQVTYRLTSALDSTQAKETDASPAVSGTAAASPFDSRAVLKWRRVIGAVKINIYRDTGSGFKFVVQLNGSATTWADDVPIGGEGSDTFPATNNTIAPPDYLNPQHYRRAVDRQNNPMSMILNGAGLPAGVGIGTGSGSGTSQPGYRMVRYYRPGDFLLLGVPTSF